MWLNKKIKGKISSLEITEATVGGRSGEGLHLSGSHDLAAAAQVLPYGLKSNPKNGESAAVLSLEDSVLSLGVIKSAAGVEPGEIMLYSDGGAYIHLKKDGTVRIKGKKITLEEG